MVWGKAEYHVNQVKVNEKTIRKIKITPPLKENPPTLKALSCREMIRLEPHQGRIILMKIKESPGESLLLYPTEQYSSQTDPLLVTVNQDQQVPVLLNNPSKVYRFIKTDTVIAQYEPYSGLVEPSDGQVNSARIENSLEPENDVAPQTGSRIDRLQHCYLNRNGRIWILNSGSSYRKRS